MNHFPKHYYGINDFFSAFSLHHALRLLDKLLFSAAAETSWSGRFPANAVYFAERLTALSQVAFTVNAAIVNLPGVIIEEKEQSGSLWLLTRYETYCGKHGKSTPWHFFPRSLTQKEFCNPYQPLNSYTEQYTQGEWKQLVNDLLYYALSPHPISELITDINLLEVRLHLHKLIEAAHLIEVRISRLE